MLKDLINKKIVKKNISINNQFTKPIENLEFQSEIKKLNSRISFITEKMEKITKQQEQILCHLEQVLFHTSGSFSSEEKSDTTVENTKKLVNNKLFRHLN